MLTSLQWDVKERRHEIDSLVKELTLIELVVEKYPNLSVWHDRHGEPHYFSSTINPLADQIDFIQTASVMAVRLSITYYNIQVCTDPPDFTLAREYYTGTGYIEDPTWRESMTAACINPNILKKLEIWINEHPPQD